jgi:hypothetical protein
VLVLQRVDEAKDGKNRVHLDAHPPVGTAVQHVERLEALGGTRVGDWVTEIAGIRWQVMRDPQGNELCIVDDEWPAGEGG